MGKSCGQAGNLGNLQVPSCRSHTVSSSRFSISSYSHTLQCVPSGLGNPRMYFGAKRRLEAPEGPLAGQLLVLLEHTLGNAAGSGSPAVKGRPATQPCARDRWKLTDFFGTEIFMGQEPHGLSQWPRFQLPESAAAAPGEGWIQVTGAVRGPGSSSATEEPSQLPTVGSEGCRNHQMLSLKLQDLIGVGTSWGAAERRGGSPRPSTGIKSLHQHHFHDGVWDFIFFFFLTAVFSPPISLSLSPSGLFLSFAGAQEFS